jgi:HEAT repeat protein
MHQHKCSLCGTMWQHGEEYDRDMREHECRVCGCHQYRTYKNRDPGEQPTATTQTLSDLLEALGNVDSFVRSTTIFKLEVSDPAAQGVLPRLAELARTDTEPLVRLAAVETLRRFGVVTLIPAVAEVLKDQHPEVRRAAALALGDLLTLGELDAAGQNAQVALTNHLDSNSRVREAIAAALWRIHPKSGACWQVVMSSN